MNSLGLNLDALIPVALVLSMAAITIAAIHYRFRTRQQVLKTLEHVLEGNPSLNVDAIKAVAKTAEPNHLDFRRGMVLLAIALAGCVLGLVVWDENGKVFLALSSFPALIGLTYLIFHAVERRSTND